MRTIHIFGSSHANRIYNSFIKQGLKNTIVQKTVKPGAVVKDLPIRNIQKLGSKDILIVQLFGNEIIHKNITVEKRPKGKTIHLTKFEPKSQQQILESYTYIYKVFKTVKAKIVIIDNPVRHLKCCSKHIHTGLLTFQARQNKILKRFFQEYTVLKHEHLIGYKRFPVDYDQLFIDTVHLKEELYDEMVKKLIKFNKLN